MNKIFTALFHYLLKSFRQLYNFIHYWFFIYFWLKKSGRCHLQFSKELKFLSLSVIAVIKFATLSMSRTFWSICNKFELITKETHIRGAFSCLNIAHFLLIHLIFPGCCFLLISLRVLLVISHFYLINETSLKISICPWYHFLGMMTMLRLFTVRLTDSSFWLLNSCRISTFQRLPQPLNILTPCD